VAVGGEIVGGETATAGFGAVSSPRPQAPKAKKAPPTNNFRRCLAEISIVFLNPYNLLMITIHA
jgi:hypothetical protein